MREHSCKWQKISGVTHKPLYPPTPHVSHKDMKKIHKWLKLKYDSCN